MRFFFCFLLTALVVRAQHCDPQAAAQTILENEKQFVAKGLEEDARAASLAFLADDAIIFEPGPVHARKVWTERTEAPLALQWQPSFFGIARSCDLAFTSGPAEWRKDKNDEKPLGYGLYISIWQKQSDGTWKVVLDVGGAIPSEQKVEGLPVLSISGPPAAKTPAAAAKKLRAAEKWFVDTAKIDSTSALIGASSEEIRVHREGVFPANGRRPADLMLSVRRGKLTTEHLGGDLSAAGDLAYRYGKYKLELSQKTERGYYLQIWQTDAAGAWKLVVDYQSPLGPEIKKIGK